jgi:CRP-like cAMP-binding protein
MVHLVRQSAHNRLLSGLSSEDFEFLVPNAQLVTLNLKDILHQPEQPIDVVYFLESGIVSMLTPMEDGHSMEVGLVGYEGMVGVPIILGTGSAPCEALVQAKGTAWRLRSSDLKAAFDERAGLRSRLLRYVQAFHVQVAQTAACNGRHPLDERLARWLLMAHDRTDGDEFPMTQEFLSRMLGVRRAGISVAAHGLQMAGTINYKHGKIAVLDRPKLEAASCECYAVVRRQFEQLLGHPLAQGAGHIHAKSYGTG